MTASSNPQQYYLFGRGAVRLSVRYVSLATPGERAMLWQGLRQLLRIGNPGVTPGRLEVMTTADGNRGLIATLSGPGRTGRAAVVAAPSGSFAIEMIMLGPSSTAPVIRTSGLPVMRSLRFPAAAR